MNMAIDTHIYYIPFYFQAAKATTAEGSGVRFLPYLLPVFILAVVAGTFVTKFRRYAPLMGVGAAIMATGSGLLHTLTPNSTAVQWICYQIITGAGFGMGFQIPYTAVQVVLSEDDVPSGNALVVFSQAMGGALAISIAQNILSASLNKELSILGLRDSVSASIDATKISTQVQPEQQGEVRWAYSDALSATMILPVAASLIAFFCSLGMENKSLARSK